MIISKPTSGTGPLASLRSLSRLVFRSQTEILILGRRHWAGRWSLMQRSIVNLLRYPGDLCRADGCDRFVGLHGARWRSLVVPEELVCAIARPWCRLVCP